MGDMFNCAGMTNTQKGHVLRVKFVCEVSQRDQDMVKLTDFFWPLSCQPKVYSGVLHVWL